MMQKDLWPEWTKYLDDARRKEPGSHKSGLRISKSEVCEHVFLKRKCKRCLASPGGLR